MRRGMSLSNISIVGAMIFATAGGMPLAMLMERLHASGKLVGLLSTVALAAGVFQVISALLTEQLPSRKPMWFWSNLSHRLLWMAVPLLLVLASTVLPGLMPHLPVLLIVSLGISAVFASMGSAPWLSWMSDFLPDHLRGRFWAMRNAFVYGAMLVAVFVYGWILDLECFPKDQSLLGLTGFILVFLTAVLAGVGELFIHNKVLEPVPHRHTGRTELGKALLTPLRNREFTRVMLCVGIWNFAIFLAAPFSGIFLKEAYHVTYSHLSYFAAAAGGGGIVGAFVARLVVDRMGARPLSAISVILFGACLLIWFFMNDAPVRFAIPLLGSFSLPQPILLLIIINFPCGMFLALIGTCQNTLITSQAPAEHRTISIALFQAGTGIMGAAGSFLGGFLVDGYREFFASHPMPFTLPMGDTITYFHVLIVLQLVFLWLVLVPFHLSLKESRGGVSFRNAVLGLVSVNPMRTVTNMFNLHTLQSSPEPLRKARAIRELGDSRMAIAVADLIGQLDDPDADVREEAAMALGRIGSPQAIEGLLLKLEGADSVMAPEIAKALRKSRDPRSVAPLIQKLREQDPNLQAESARTLGLIGDKRAVKSLLELLYGSQDEKVISASSEALARLGEMDAIFKILPRMRDAKNAVSKRSMACAVGDLLGTPGAFYRVLHAEHQAYGKKVGELLARLKEEVREATHETWTPAGRNIIGRVEQLESVFLLRDYKACVNQSLELAIALSALKYGIQYGGDAEVFVEALIWHDQRFGVGTWYLDLLRQSPVADELESLLAVYFLSTWTRPAKAHG
ncbi:MAG: MFS transporter [Kiritimatiellia bacterium]